MNIKSILTQLGLDDGSGNISSMRIVVALVVLAILIPKVIFACKTGTEITFSQQDLYAIGTVLGAKLAQNFQESSTPKPPTP